ncbi:uncharacterized protein M421DRAFT_105964 [Didymella exigua CBS 183.55]|uniref:Uncharacterized protein n=1 Tax=Didymella exigua CBS 183.55 TaxID=1150837 RepID=A0A6A5S5Q6_9PLEO|nr:uncharacterized protein M421DRAFT_105964 [Didymella exigua CBS 183.55]KAF1933826.1 hypothetical protein M421DRAFT_105964 [Didymella exigua CBS 183.55]
MFTASLPGGYLYPICLTALITRSKITSYSILSATILAQCEARSRSMVSLLHEHGCAYDNQYRQASWMIAVPAAFPVVSRGHVPCRVATPLMQALGNVALAVVYSALIALDWRDQCLIRCPSSRSQGCCVTLRLHLYRNQHKSVSRSLQVASPFNFAYGFGSAHVRPKVARDCLFQGQKGSAPRTPARCSQTIVTSLSGHTSRPRSKKMVNSFLPSRIGLGWSQPSAHLLFHCHYFSFWSIAGFANAYSCHCTPQ